VIATLTASLASERERVEALDVQLQEVQADYGELDAKLFAEVDRADKAETAFNQCAEENHRNVNRSMVAESECADARASLAAAEAELDTWKFVFGVDESTKYLTLEQAEIMWRDRITAARSEAVAHAFEWLEKRGFYRKTVGDSPLFEFVGPVLDFPAYLAHLSKEPTK
jgi:multidrug resistance efflux pump